MCANIWSPAAVEIQLALWMRTYAQPGLVFRFVFICGAQRPEGIISGLQYVFLSESDFTRTLDKAVYLLIQIFAHSIKHAIVVRETTYNHSWKIESIDSFLSEDCNISEYTFYNLNRATLLSCDFWGWARGCCYSRRRRQLGLFNYNTDGVTLLSQILQLLS